MLLNCGVGEDSCESLGLKEDPTSPFWRRSTLEFLWREWCWSWSSSTLATSCEELTHWKRLWWWERLGAVGERDDQEWDGWMASRTRWTWVWVNSGRWWWTGSSGVLWFMGSQRVGHNWATELNWTELMLIKKNNYPHLSVVSSLACHSLAFLIAKPSQSKDQQPIRVVLWSLSIMQHYYSLPWTNQNIRANPIVMASHD